MDSMEDFWKWASMGDGHALAAMVIVATVIVTSGNIIVRLSQMLTRIILVWVRGWPPSYLDADGDHHGEELPKKTKK